MFSPYCEVCDRWFPHAKALSQHLQDSWVTHPFCKFCHLSFGNSGALTRHFNECHYECTSCDKTFSTFKALQDHCDSKHYYCRECDRLFQSAANLTSHLGSSLHAPRSYRCPGQSCNRSFVSISAIILHVESGACPSGVTRKFINSQVARIDTQHAITNPERMITGGAETEYWATERSWNGYGYECVLCRAEFQSLNSLNQHLKSPRHLQPFYHCPKRACGLQFTVLSALCQHVERGSCGARETRLVQDAVKRLSRSMKTITF